MLVTCRIIDDYAIPEPLQTQVLETLRAVFPAAQVEFLAHFPVRRGQPSWVSALEALGTGPGIALVDSHMPGPNDGVEFIRQLRARGYRGFTYLFMGVEETEQCTSAVEGNSTLLGQPGAGAIRKYRPQDLVDVLKRDLGALDQAYGVDGHDTRAVEESREGRESGEFAALTVRDPAAYLEDPLELALQLLSAILPHSLCWPADQSSPVPGAAFTLQFERDVTRNLAALRTNSATAPGWGQCQGAASRVSELIATNNHTPWPDGAAPTSLDEALRRLTSSPIEAALGENGKVKDSFNLRLAALRNQILGEA